MNENIIMLISVSIGFGLIAAVWINLFRGRREDEKHQYETRIVELENGKFQVEEFNYAPDDWFGEYRMVWHPINSNSFGVGGEVDTLEDAIALRDKHNQETKNKFRPNVIKVVD